MYMIIRMHPFRAVKGRTNTVDGKNEAMPVWVGAAVEDPRLLPARGRASGSKGWSHTFITCAHPCCLEQMSATQQHLNTEFGTEEVDKGIACVSGTGPGVFTQPQHISNSGRA